MSDMRGRDSGTLSVAAGLDNSDERRSGDTLSRNFADALTAHTGLQTDDSFALVHHHDQAGTSSILHLGNGDVAASEDLHQADLSNSDLSLTANGGAHGGRQGDLGAATTHGVHHAPPPVSAVSGQLWAAFGGPGAGGGNPDGHSDFRVEHADSDGLSNDDIIQQEGGSGGEYAAIGLDTTANLSITLDGNFHMHVTNLATGVDLTNTVVASIADADTVNSYAVNAVTNTIFMDLDGYDYTTHGGDIIKITYNQSTGVITNPYTWNDGTHTGSVDTHGILIDSTSTGQVYQDGRAFVLSGDGNTLYYVDDDNNNPGGFFGASTNGVYKVSTSGDVGDGNAPTPVLLSSQVQFPTNDSAGYITGLAVDEAKGIIYFTTDGSAEGVNTSEDGIWWMPIAGGTATKMTIPGGVAVDFPVFYGNGLALDIRNQQLYYSDKQTGEIVQFTLSADGHSFTAGTNLADFDTDGGTQAGHDGAFANQLVFDDLPTLGALSATSTEAVQGGSAVTLLTAQPTLSDNDNADSSSATITITNAQAGDNLFCAGVQSGTVSGVTVSWNSSTHVLTLSGEASFATYKSLLAQISFQDSGVDNSVGSHPTRTINWTMGDGVSIVHPSTVDSNEQTTTVVIDRAPTVVNDNYAVQESGNSSGTSGTGGTGVLGNDSDKDADAIVVSAVNGSGANVGFQIAGTYGHLTLNANGSYSYDATITSAIDSAAFGSHPVDTFTYTDSDGLGGVTTGTVSFTINRAPTLVVDSGNALESFSGSGNVLTNDTDHDGDSLTVSAVNGSGANVGNSVAGTWGHITINADGSYTYNADDTAAIDGAATGSHLTDTFTYTASDGHGGSTTTTLTITLDRAPTVVNDNYGTIAEGASTGAVGAGSGVLINDSDRDGDSLTVSAVSGSGANVGFQIATTYGHITLNADGGYTYLANNTAAIDAAANGSHPVDVVSFTVSDGHGGTTNETLSFTIDRPATATADSLDTTENTSATVGSGSPVNANLLANDVDRDGDTITITAVNGNAAFVGTQITLASGALLTVNADGTYTYDPNHVFDYLADTLSGASDTQATDSFTYTVDGGSTVSVIVTVNGVDSNDTLIGTTGNDTINGGIGDDIFYDDNGALSGRDPHDISAGKSGGTDSFSGGSGDDNFVMGANLTAADSIDGGTGSDRVALAGDYSAGLTFGATTVTNVEILTLGPGFSYNLTMNNATVTAGNTLTVQAGQLGAGDSLTFDASNDTSGGKYVINSGAGNDLLIGGANNDTFRSGTGNDTIRGNGGKDVINMDGNLTAADQIDGGSGKDTVSVTGDYTGGNAVTFGATTMVNVEIISMTAGFSYDFVMNAATLQSGQTLTVNATTLGAGDNVTFDGSAVVDGGNFVMNTGAGNDVLTGGAGDDTFRSGAGNDTINGGGGDDTINMGAFLTAADQIDGGGGTNSLFLQGDYSAGITFGSTTIANIQSINLAAGDSYNFTLNALNVADGASLAVKAGTLGASDNLTFDASALGSNSSVVIHSGAGADVLLGGGGSDVIDGGDGNDTITGGGGGDVLTGGNGSDTFVYSAASESTSTGYDKITDFDATSDFIKLNGYSVLAIDAEVTSGKLSLNNFDNNLTHAIGGAQLAAHDAVLFTPDTGTLAGHTFLIVDLNGVAGYQAGQDLVIDITGGSHLGSLSTGDFI